MGQFAGTAVGPISLGLLLGREPVGQKIPQMKPHRTRSAMLCIYMAPRSVPRVSGLRGVRVEVAASVECDALSKVVQYSHQVHRFPLALSRSNGVHMTYLFEQLDPERFQQFA